MECHLISSQGKLLKLQSCSPWNQWQRLLAHSWGIEESLIVLRVHRSCLHHQNCYSGLACQIYLIPVIVINPFYFLLLQGNYYIQSLLFISSLGWNSGLLKTVLVAMHSDSVWNSFWIFGAAQSPWCWGSSLWPLKHRSYLMTSYATTEVKLLIRT